MEEKVSQTVIDQLAPCLRNLQTLDIDGEFVMGEDRNNVTDLATKILDA